MEARDFALKGPGRLIRSPVHEGQRARSSSSSAITVKASIDRIVPEAKALREIGIGTIAIMPNDTDAYPQDSFDNMKAFSDRHGFTFPYVIDTTQESRVPMTLSARPTFSVSMHKTSCNTEVGLMPRALHWCRTLVATYSRR